MNCPDSGNGGEAGYNWVMGWLSWILGRGSPSREEILSEPFRKEWLELVQRVLPSFGGLVAEQQRYLCESIQLFVAQKQFRGLDGLDITDQIRLAIAAPACLLLAGIPAAGVYPRVREIIVRPHAFGKVTEAIGPTGRRYRIPELHAGEAWLRGPIVLAWDNVRRSIAHPCDGYNVVYHEFAHALDMQTGLSGGGLALRTREAQGEWRRVFNEAYRAFVAANARGDTLRS